MKIIKKINLIKMTADAVSAQNPNFNTNIKLVPEETGDDTQRKLQLSLDQLIEQNAAPEKQSRRGRQPSNRNEATFNGVMHEPIRRGMRQTRRALPYNGLYCPIIPQKSLNRVSTQTNVADSALSEIDIQFPPSDAAATGDALLVRFKNTNVIRVTKSRGDIILDSGGWRTISTRLVINSALKPLGFWIETSSSDNTTSSEKSNNEDQPMEANSQQKFQPEANWTIVDGSSFLATFKDAMTLGAVGSKPHGHLLARASVIAQHLKQVKNNAIMRKRNNRQLQQINSC